MAATLTRPELDGKALAPYTFLSCSATVWSCGKCNMPDTRNGTATEGR